MDIDNKVVEDLQNGDDEMLMMDMRRGSWTVEESGDDEIIDLRRGPWTVEEDLNLINNISKHGDGRWNSLARSSGLRRTGKSCRLRWLNYLRPDVRRGNITPKEQLLILELHSRWGNRWSKIAQHLPGRTDNEIKNYWRTRVQKHAKQLKCDVNSKQFKDTMRYLWMPRLVERIQAASSTAATSVYQFNHSNLYSSGDIITTPETICGGYTSENSSTATSSESLKTGVSQIYDLTENNYPVINNNNNNEDYNYKYYNSNCYYPVGYSETLINTSGNLTHLGTDTKPMEESNDPWFDIDNYNGDTISDTIMWNVEDIWFLKQAAASLQQHPLN